MSLVDEKIQEFRMGFNKYYYEKILPVLGTFEQQRCKELLKYNLILYLFITFAICAPIIFVHYYEKYMTPAILQSLGRLWTLCILVSILLGVILLVSVVFILYKIKKSFEYKVKKSSLNLFLSYFGNISWTPKKTIPLFEIINSKLITLKPDFIALGDDLNKTAKVYGDDFFEGEYDNVNIKIAETMLLYKPYIYLYKMFVSKRNVRTRIFSGIFSQFRMNKIMNSHTIIQEKGIRDWDVKVGLIFSINNLSSITIEDVDFDKKFEIFTNNTIDAKNILTKDFKQYFMNLKTAFNAHRIAISIKDDNCLLMIHSRRDSFVLGDIRKSITDLNEIQQFFDQFVAILALVSSLKQTNRQTPL